MQDINLKDVSYCYPNGFCAVDNINIEIEKGENVVIIGQNGAGKTTTVKMMNGLLKPSSGNVLIGDKNTKDYTTAQISRHVGYVFQNPDDQIFHSTVELEVRYGPAIMGLSKEIEDQRVERALKMTGLTKHRDENPYNLPLSIRKFVTIAAIIAMDTDVMIFDEPTAGQDLEGTQQLIKVINTLHEEGKTLITISHDMEFAANYFEKIIVMANKKVVKIGKPENIFYDFKTLDQAMLKQPYVCRIISKLGVESNAISLNDAAEVILEKWKQDEK